MLLPFFFSKNPLNSPSSSKRRKIQKEKKKKKSWLPFYLWESSCARSFSESVHHGSAENTKEKKMSVLYEGIVPYNVFFSQEELEFLHKSVDF
jgi:hypothetical protein